jgi:hypothetical protein
MISLREKNTSTTGGGGAAPAGGGGAAAQAQPSGNQNNDTPLGDAEIRKFFINFAKFAVQVGFAKQAGAGGAADGGGDAGVGGAGQSQQNYANVHVSGFDKNTISGVLKNKLNIGDDEHNEIMSIIDQVHRGADLQRLAADRHTHELLVKLGYAMAAGARIR